MSAQVLRMAFGGVCTLAFLILPLESYAQCCGSSGCSAPARKAPSYGEGGGSDKLSTPEPYGGQVFCPVTGEKLGLRTPPMAVTTTIGEKKPSFIGKLFGKKPIPGVVIYVCCPDCVAKIQNDPQTHLNEVIADKGCFSYTYASAPARRPVRVRTGAGGYLDLPAPEQYGGQKTCPVTGQALGSMGPAIPVTAKGKTIYVCCQACVSEVERDPDIYLAKMAVVQRNR